MMFLFRLFQPILTSLEKGECDQDSGRGASEEEFHTKVPLNDLNSEYKS